MGGALLSIDLVFFSSVEFLVGRDGAFRRRACRVRSLAARSPSWWQGAQPEGKF